MSAPVDKRFRGRILMNPAPVTGGVSGDTVLMDAAQFRELTEYVKSTHA